MTRLCLLLAVLVVAWAPLTYGVPDPVAPEADEGGAVPSPAAARQRDPFRPFILDMHPEARMPLTPLQRYEIGQLTVVATMWDVNPPRAMVEDSVGMGYIVTLGTPIGRNGGVVMAIEPQRVVVEERVLDFYGKERVNRIAMETPQEEGPKPPPRERR